MGPSRKRKSDEMAEPTTPETSNTPAPKKMRITQTQKQALIDNLQLEITQRARHLRAHYALQCADLKSRIERRVNRIPMAMRTMTMAELMAKHNPAPEPPAKPIVVQKTQPSATRPARKRKSSIVIAADPIQESANENEDEPTITTISAARPAPLPKTRTAKRPGSRTGKATGTGGVLSPRSHNSRTLPRSPIKTATTNADCQPTHAPLSPTKSHIAPPRMLSPIKPASPLKSAALATTSAITSSMHSLLSTAKSTASRGKAAARAVQNRTVSQTSTNSAASTSTTTSTGTVVKPKERPTRGRAAATAKKTAAAAQQDAPVMAAPPVPEKGNAVTIPPRTKSRAATATSTVKKGAATVKKVAPEPAAAPATTGRRILRKRN